MLAAARAGRLDELRALLERGENVDTRCADNASSALIAACGRNYVQIVHELVERGAQLNLVNSYGCSALDDAESRGHTEIATYLRSRGARHGTRLPFALHPRYFFCPQCVVWFMLVAVWALEYAHWLRLPGLPARAIKLGYAPESANSQAHNPTIVVLRDSAPPQLMVTFRVCNWGIERRAPLQPRLSLDGCLVDGAGTILRSFGSLTVVISCQVRVRCERFLRGVLAVPCAHFLCVPRGNRAKMESPSLSLTCHRCRR